LAAVDHALPLAERFGATVHALFVVEADPIEHSAPALDSAERRETLRAERERATTVIKQRAGNRGVASTSEVGEGVPENAILGSVDDRGIDPVAMGTHGRDGPDRYLIGSVTDG
jgi:nucleotide-binding universal stress UspA family protein